MIMVEEPPVAGGTTPPFLYSISITIRRCVWFVVMLIGAVFPHSSLSWSLLFKLIFVFHHRFIFERPPPVHSAGTR